MIVEQLHLTVTDVPPPGQAMTFPEWSSAIVAGESGAHANRGSAARLCVFTINEIGCDCSRGAGPAFLRIDEMENAIGETNDPRKTLPLWPSAARPSLTLPAPCASDARRSIARIAG
jgi:hypothetical protein